MRFKILGLCVLAVTFFSSCKQSPSNRSKDDGMTVHINMRDTSKLFALSQITEDISLIYLQSDSLSYFDFIQDFRQFDGKFYFVTAQRKVLLIFAEDGKFIQRIKMIGKGPQEYSVIDSYTVDQDKKLLVIYDASLRKFLTFSLNGEFISSRSTSLFGREIAWQGGYYYLYAPDNKNQVNSEIYNPGLFVLDSCFNLVKQILKLESEKYPCIRKNMVASGDKLLFMPFGSNNMYSINQLRIEKLYEINYGKHGFSDSAELESMHNLEELKSKNKAWAAIDYCVGSDFAFIQEAVGHSMMKVFFSPSRSMINQIIRNDLIGPYILTPLYGEERDVYFYSPHGFIPDQKGWSKVYSKFHKDPPPEDLLKKNDEARAFIEKNTIEQILVKIKVRKE